MLVAAHFAPSQAEPVKHTFRRNKPLELCIPHFVYTKRIERCPFCPPPPGWRPARVPDPR